MIFAQHRPFDIYPARVNACKCQTCESARLLKLAVLKHSKIINEPVHLYVNVLPVYEINIYRKMAFAT